MGARRQLHGVVLALWLLSSPFLVVVQPGVVSADAGYAVASDSMEPEITRGSLVLVEAVSPRTVEVGDVITFRGEGNVGPTTTHRVVGIQRNDAGFAFVVKGDANRSPDNEPVDASRVVGRVTATIPWVGYPVLATDTGSALVFLFVVPAMLLALERGQYLLSAVE
jgi:signal peptidase